MKHQNSKLLKTKIINHKKRGMQILGKSFKHFICYSVTTPLKPYSPLYILCNTLKCYNSVTLVTLYNNKGGLDIQF